jgi:hypothetical protein
MQPANEHHHIPNWFFQLVSGVDIIRVIAEQFRTFPPALDHLDRILFSSLNLCLCLA